MKYTLLTNILLGIILMMGAIQMADCMPSYGYGHGYGYGGYGHGYGGYGHHGYGGYGHGYGR